MSIQLRRFIIDISVNAAVCPEVFTAADQLHDALGSAAFPAWVYSIDLVEPGPDHAPVLGSDD